MEEMGETKKIFEFLTPKVLSRHLSSDMTVRQAMEVFDVHKYNVLPLISLEGDYISTLSEGDLLRFVKNKAEFDVRIAETASIMEVERHRPYKAVGADVSFDELCDLMQNQNFVPLLDDRGKFVGIVRRSAVFRYLKEFWDKR